MKSWETLEKTFRRLLGKLFQFIKLIKKVMKKFAKCLEKIYYKLINCFLTKIHLSIYF